MRAEFGVEGGWVDGEFDGWRAGLLVLLLRLLLELFFVAEGGVDDGGVWSCFSRLFCAFWYCFDEESFPSDGVEDP